MTPDTASPDQVRRAVRDLLRTRVTDGPRRIAMGYGNENWYVGTGSGPFVIKISRPDGDLTKITAAVAGHRAAVDHGTPTPRLVVFEPNCAAVDGRAVRVLDHLPGVHPSTVITADRAPEFFTDLGRAVATLHTVRYERFSSRVGGEPSFPTWTAYVDHRVPQILQRALDTDLYPAATWRAMLARAQRVARSVSPQVRPALVHRDLYPDNLLATPDGRFLALIDFDLAEVWDPIVDWVKPRWQIFGRWPGSEQAFRDGYHQLAGPVADLDRRLWVVEVLELANHAANAGRSGNPGFAAEATDRLAQVLDSPPA